MAEIGLSDEILYDLQQHTLNYLAKSSQTNTVIRSERDLIDLLKNVSLKNMTPNGSVISKKTVSLEYNLVAKAYFDLIKKLHIESEIEKIHFLLILELNPLLLVKGT